MRRAAERGVAEGMILLGHSDAREVLWASDCGVLPSRKEGFGLVVVEGMACGVVQVRTPSAGARDTTIDERRSPRIWITASCSGPESTTIQLRGACVAWVNERAVRRRSATGPAWVTTT